MFSLENVGVLGH